MSPLDYVVLLGTMLGIAAFGFWHTRSGGSLHTYLKGNPNTGWATIGISVMATQASAVTFISTPGQGYESGLDFVQNYFGLPLALILIAAVFLPMYRRLNVYTAYEFLGRRFDMKTRLLGTALFLLQRGVAAGLTIYAPAIILSTVLGWRLDVTIVLSAIVVLVYTVSGGSEAVNLTQKFQLAVIFGAMIAAFAILLAKLPADLSFTDALTVAGGFKRMQAVDFSLNVHRRYTFWSGLFGGFFLSLSYFGVDQSQVQRYISGGSLRESRLGLMFNAVFKIPMQFFILLLGVMLFVFYQFEKPPIYFNERAWTTRLNGGSGVRMQSLDQEFAAVHAEKEQHVREWLAARHRGDHNGEEQAKVQMAAANERGEAVRAQAEVAVSGAKSAEKANDADYVFISFILRFLPHGLIGLLISAFFAATLSSKAAELNALGSATTVDLYRHVIRRNATDAHYLAASKWLTLMWGVIALAVALCARLVENLIQAVNIVGSIFYGVLLGLFVVAFFVKRVGGTAVFWGGLAAQSLVIILYACRLPISYLWYNLIGCVACVVFSLALQAALGLGPPAPEPQPT